MKRRRAASSAPDRRRRRLLGASAAQAVTFAAWPWVGTAAAPASAAAAGSAGLGPKVLRVAMQSEETTFDPARVSDLYSHCVMGHIFETLYRYDPLARPAKLRPALADGMPEVSADFKIWTVRIKRGVFFADDPAFGGKPREVTAQDVLTPFKRCVDPAVKSPHASDLLETKFLGLEQAHQAARAGKPFDYHAPIEGLKALDRYTVQFICAEPRPRLIDSLATTSLSVQALEVAQRYGDSTGDHPVGTGPFRLVQAEWRRGSRIVLERNPQYRDVFYEAEPAADDAEGQAILAKFKGRKLPMVDRVEVSIIQEAQPRWLSFLNGQLDGLVGVAALVPPEFVPQALPNGVLAPNLARRGVKLHRALRPDMAMMWFNMEDAVVGGLEPAKVALRRALALGYDTPSEIRLVRRGEGVPAQSPIVPHASGYDPAFHSEMGEYDPARANALLDLYGYRDVNGDGWRELPDGKPLVLTAATEPSLIYRQFNEVLAKSWKKLGVKVQFRTQQWPANMKAARAGKLQIWSLGNSATTPDGQGALAYFYGPSAGQANLARFKLPAFDALYDKLTALPDGPEREAVFLEVKRLAVAYMPYKIQVHRYASELTQPWLIGYRRAMFSTRFWDVVDLDMALRRERVGA